MTGDEKPNGYERGKEIGDLQATVRAQAQATKEMGESLGRSLDLLRQELHDLRDSVATKEDLKRVTLTCPQCPVLKTEIARMNDTLYGKKNGEQGLVKDVETIKKNYLKATGLATGAGFVLGFFGSKLAGIIYPPLK